MPQIFNAPVLTEVGSQLLLDALADDAGITFTRCAIGDAIYTSEEKAASALKAMTSLKSEKNTYGFTSSARTAEQLMITTTISNYDEEHEQALITTGYFITEMGVFAKSKDDPEVLLAIAVIQGAEGEYIEAYDGVSPVRIIQDVTIKIGSRPTITINYSSSQFALADDLEAVSNRVSTLEDNVSCLKLVNGKLCIKYTKEV